MVTDFNIKQVRHRGAGIFLHVNGAGATAGCVSAPRRLHGQADARSSTRRGSRSSRSGAEGVAKFEAEEVLVDVEGRTLKISNLDKVLYPRTGTTKGEVLNYYAQIAPVHAAAPQGPGGHPDPLAARRRGHELLREEHPRRDAVLGAHRDGADHRLARTASKEDGTLIFPIVDDLATLTWLVNLAALELHVHQWTVGRNGQPRNADRLVIDLDPGEPAGLHECCGVALLVRDALERARPRPPSR